MKISRVMVSIKDPTFEAESSKAEALTDLDTERTICLARAGMLGEAVGEVLLTLLAGRSVNETDEVTSRFFDSLVDAVRTVARHDPKIKNLENFDLG